MSPSLEVESTLTDRYQTTVPEAVRRTLMLSKRDKILYSIRADGEVVLSRAVTEDDQALEPFLDLLSQDLIRHPEHVQAISQPLQKRIQNLTAKVDVDLDAPLSASDD